MSSKERTVERRAFPLAELRVEEREGNPPRVVGHAAVFGRRSLPLAESGGDMLVEEIAPGAFAKTLREADVRALINHDPNLILGRTRAGTLRLAEDDRGLAVSIDLPDTQAARDLVVSMRRGDISQMSFAFAPVRQRWTKEPAGDKTLHVRLLQEVRLFDVSIVTFPAYEDTDAQVRALQAAEGVPGDLAAVLAATARAALWGRLCEAAGVPDRPALERQLAFARELREQLRAGA